VVSQIVKNAFRAIFLLLILSVGCNKPSREVFNSQGRATNQVIESELLVQLHKSSPAPQLQKDATNEFCMNAEAIRLGRRIFFDDAFSSNGAVSCASCHDPRLGFTTRDATARGLALTFRNAPSILNVSHYRWFSWDGSSDVLWAQSLKPFEHPLEFGTSRREVLRQFQSDHYIQMYESAFGNQPPVLDCHDDLLNEFFANVGKSLAAFQSTLNSGESRFDQFVAKLDSSPKNFAGSDQSILSESEIRGMRLFFGKANCVFCHNGPLFTDMEFHSVRVPPRSLTDPLDSGRFDGVDILLDAEYGSWTVHSAQFNSTTRPRVKKSGQLWGQFKTPSLRDVTRTAPYMHNGVFATIEEVVEHYSTFAKAVEVGHHEETILKPLNLTHMEKSDLVAFLGALESVDYCGDGLTID
jgi:cytochrome c peroxidase